jgi:DnaJ-class molecular chaperone
VEAERLDDGLERKPITCPACQGEGGWLKATGVPISVKFREDDAAVQLCPLCGGNKKVALALKDT